MMRRHRTRRWLRCCQRAIAPTSSPSPRAPPWPTGSPLVAVLANTSGNKKAARYIGLMYEQGLGVEQDYEAAAAWYEQGVEAGDLTSCCYLGLLYKQGLGVEQDIEKAMELYKEAAEYGDENAAPALERLTGGLKISDSLSTLQCRNKTGCPRLAKSWPGHFISQKAGRFLEFLVVEYCRRERPRNQHPHLLLLLLFRKKNQLLLWTTSPPCSRRTLLRLRKRKPKKPH